MCIPTLRFRVDPGLLDTMIHCMRGTVWLSLKGVDWGGGISGSIGYAVLFREPARSSSVVGLGFFYKRFFGRLLLSP